MFPFKYNNIFLHFFTAKFIEDIFFNLYSPYLPFFAPLRDSLMYSSNI